MPWTMHHVACPVRATTPVLLPVCPTFLLSLGVRARKEGTRDTGEASAGPKRRNQQDTSLLLAPSPSSPHICTSTNLLLFSVRRTSQKVLFFCNMCKGGIRIVLAAVSTICNTISCMSRWRNVIHAAAMPLPQLACYNCYRMDRSGTLGQRTRQRCNTETLRAHPPAC